MSTFKTCHQDSPTIFYYGSSQNGPHSSTSSPRRLYFHHVKSTVFCQSLQNFECRDLEHVELRLTWSMLNKTNVKCLLRGLETLLQNTLRLQCLYLEVPDTKLSYMGDNDSEEPPRDFCLDVGLAKTRSLHKLNLTHLDVINLGLLCQNNVEIEEISLKGIFLADDTGAEFMNTLSKVDFSTHNVVFNLRGFQDKHGTWELGENPNGRLWHHIWSCLRKERPTLPLIGGCATWELLSDDSMKFSRWKTLHTWEEERQKYGHKCWIETTKLLEVHPCQGTIVDIRTGIGLWPYDVAKSNPHHRVIGFDSPDFGPLVTLGKFQTSGLEFVVDDWESVIKQADTRLINMRDSFSWIRDLDTVISWIHKALEPDGIFQSQEIRLSTWSSNKEKVCRWRDKVVECFKRKGIQTHTASQMRDILHHYGFTEYQEKQLKWTEQECGHLYDFALSTIEASASILYDGVLEPDVGTAIIIDEAVDALREEDSQIEIPVHICWARKAKAVHIC